MRQKRRETPNTLAFVANAVENYRNGVDAITDGELNVVLNDLAAGVRAERPDAADGKRAFAFSGDLFVPLLYRSGKAVAGEVQDLMAARWQRRRDGTARSSCPT